MYDAVGIIHAILPLYYYSIALKCLVRLRYFFLETIHVSDENVEILYNPLANNVKVFYLNKTKSNKCLYKFHHF